MSTLEIIGLIATIIVLALHGIKLALHGIKLIYGSDTMDTEP